jgi:hypothetical protein
MDRGKVANDLANQNCGEKRLPSVQQFLLHICCMMHELEVLFINLSAALVPEAHLHTSGTMTIRYDQLRRVASSPRLLSLARVSFRSVCQQPEVAKNYVAENRYQRTASSETGAPLSV